MPYSVDVPDEPEDAADVEWSRGIDYASFRPTPDWSLIRDEVWVDEGADCD